MEKNLDPALGADAIARFILDGFIRVDAAFSSEIAAEARAILWAATECDPDDPTTWTRPVVRLDQFDQAPFHAAANGIQNWRAPTRSKEILLFRNSPAVSAEKSYKSVAPAGISTPMVSGAPTALNSLFPGRFRAEKKVNSETNG
ncbi:MAG: hypothetical protein COB31_00355 [Erythrobacter sp.]|nr:MAG: hypothetical protein COB31_00355 [Erythrobacter sp.]